MNNNVIYNSTKIQINGKNYFLSNIERYINYTLYVINSSRKIKDFKHLNLKSTKGLMYFNISTTNGYNHYIKVFKELGIIKLSDIDFKYGKKHKCQKYNLNFSMLEKLIKLFIDASELYFYDFGELNNLLHNRYISDDFKELLTGLTPTKRIMYTQIEQQHSLTVF